MRVDCAVCAKLIKNEKVSNVLRMHVRILFCLFVGRFIDFLIYRSANCGNRQKTVNPVLCCENDFFLGLIAKMMGTTE